MFTKLPAIKGSITCLCCDAGSHDSLDMHKLLAVGFGNCAVYKNGDQIYSETETSDEKLWVAQQAEDLATADPGQDWRIRFDAPLYQATYQRQGPELWILVEKGEGFA